MKTIYRSGSKKTRKSTVEVGEAFLPEGKRFQVLLSNDPEVIDTVVCKSIDTVAPDVLLVVHSSLISWTIDPEWQKK